MKYSEATMQFVVLAVERDNRNRILDYIRRELDKPLSDLIFHELPEAIKFPIKLEEEFELISEKAPNLSEADALAIASLTSAKKNIAGALEGILKYIEKLDFFDKNHTSSMVRAIATSLSKKNISEIAQLSRKAAKDASASSKRFSSRYEDFIENSLPELHSDTLAWDLLLSPLAEEAGLIMEKAAEITEALEAVESQPEIFEKAVVEKEKTS